MRDPFAGDRTTRVRLVRSDGEELVMGDGLPWVIEFDGLDGFARLDLSVSTSQNVLTDGSSLVSKRVNETDREVKATYIGSDRPGARARAVAFFNPRFSFAMHATVGNRTRWCEGELSGFDCPARSPRLPVALTFTLTCLDPFWRSENGHTESFTDSRPMFGFPYVCKTKGTKDRSGKKLTYGAPASILIYDGENTIYNDGDVPCMYRIHTDFNGSVTNPVYTKDGRFVKVVHAFSDGDELLIDFESAPPKVEINGKTAIKNCTRDSSFTGMEMQPGDNVFDYSCDDPTNHKAYMDVQLLYNDRYLGV